MVADHEVWASGAATAANGTVGIRAERTASRGPNRLARTEPPLADETSSAAACSVRASIGSGSGGRRTRHGARDRGVADPAASMRSAYMWFPSCSWAARHRSALDSAITLERTHALVTPAATHLGFRVVG